jgi:hypothetical protein
MKVHGISVVRSQVSGQVDIAATLASWVKSAEEKFQKEYVEFQAALQNKLNGGKDNENVIADLLVQFFSQPSYKGAVNSVTVPRKFVVDWVAPKLIDAGLFHDEKKGMLYADAREAVEKFIFDNADTEAAPREDAWFRVTTGRGRVAGLVTERRRPIPEDLTVDPNTVPAELAQAPAENPPENTNAAPTDPLAEFPVNPETEAQIEQANAALNGNA